MPRSRRSLVAAQMRRFPVTSAPTANRSARFLGSARGSAGKRPSLPGVAAASPTCSCSPHRPPRPRSPRGLMDERHRRRGSRCGCPSPDPDGLSVRRRAQRAPVLRRWLATLFNFFVSRFTIPMLMCLTWRHATSSNLAPDITTKYLCPTQSSTPKFSPSLGSTTSDGGSCPPPPSAVNTLARTGFLPEPLPCLT